MQRKLQRSSRAWPTSSVATGRSLLPRSSYATAALRSARNYLPPEPCVVFPSELYRLMDLQPELISISFGKSNCLLYALAESWVRESYAQGQLDRPYWARVWPSAKALAGFL